MPKTANYPKHLDQEICKQMTNLVELLTTSGKSALNPDIMKKFKRLCSGDPDETTRYESAHLDLHCLQTLTLKRTSDAYVEYACELLFTQLMRNHAEIRLSAFQMIDELFNRSHAFRQSLLTDFQCFLELSVGTSLDRPLPPPKPAALTMKTEACKAIHQWHGKFGEAYKKLSLGYQFLKDCKKVDFDGIQARAELERRQQEETERKLEENRQQKLISVLAEMEESSSDIDLCIKEIGSCLELLIPHPDSFFIGDSETLADAASNTGVKPDVGIAATEQDNSNLMTETSAALGDKANDGCSSCNGKSNPDDGVTECKVHGNGNDTVSENKKIQSKHKQSNNDLNKTATSSSSEDSTVEHVPKTELLNPTSVSNATTDSVTGENVDVGKQQQTDEKSNCDNAVNIGVDKSNTINERNCDNHASSFNVGNQQQPSNRCTVTSDVVKSRKANETEEKDDTNTDASTSNIENQRQPSSNSTGFHKVDKEVKETDDKDGSESEYETDEEFEEVNDNSWFTKDHGLFNRKYELSIEVGGESSRLKETEDNRDIIRGARDQYKLIKTKFLPNIKRWIQALEKHGGKQEDIKRVESLKSQLQDSQKRCLELEIISEADSRKRANDSDSDEEFEEVREKEGYEENVPEHVRLEALRAAAVSAKQKTTRGKRRGKRTQKWLPSDIDQDPTSWQANILKLGESIASSSSVTSTPPATVKHKRVSDDDRPSTSVLSVKVKMEPHDDSSDSSTPGLSRLSSESRKQQLLDKAPVIPFGVDLEHWENPESMEAPMKVSYDDLSRFWVPGDGDDRGAASEDLASLTRRTTTYVGEFTPIKWKCRTALPSGKLCERMDREKCPFHGKIIARDLRGQPNDPVVNKNRLAEGTNIKLEEIPPEDQDTDLQAAIQASLDADPGPQPSGSEVMVELEQSGSEVKGKSKSPGSKGKRKGKQKAAKRKHPNLTDITPPSKSSRDRLESKIFKKSTLSRVNANMDAIDAKKVRDKFSNQFNYSLK